MEIPPVQEFICELAGSIDSPLWQPLAPFPSSSPFRIDALLLHNHALERYIYSHGEEVSEFQMKSLDSMLKCSQNGLGGIMHSCPSCITYQYMPFRCHSRACPRCGKEYARQWGNELMHRFCHGTTGM